MKMKSTYSRMKSKRKGGKCNQRYNLMSFTDKVKKHTYFGYQKKKKNRTPPYTCGSKNIKENY